MINSLANSLNAHVLIWKYWSKMAKSTKIHKCKISNEYTGEEFFAKKKSICKCIRTTIRTIVLVVSNYSVNNKPVISDVF